MPSSPGSQPRSEWQRHSTIGMQFALTIAVFGFLGYWLDGKWGTDPWLLIAFIFLGFFGGLISMVKKVSKIGRHGKGKPSGNDDDAGGS